MRQTSPAAVRDSASFATGGFHVRAGVFSSLSGEISDFSISIAPLDAPSLIPAGACERYFGQASQCFVVRETEGREC